MIEENTIYNADCLEIMRDIPDNYFDLLLTDPPYGINLKMQRFPKHDRSNSRTNRIKHEGFDDSGRPDKIYFDEMFRVSKNQIIWGATNFYDLLPLNDSWIFWDKMNGDGSHFADGEFAFTSFSRASKKFTISAHHGTRGGLDRIHPTQKPVELFRWIIWNYSNEGDFIFDPFSGSGTTAIAADDLNRKFVCVEKDSNYFQKSVKRLEESRSQVKLFT